MKTRHRPITRRLGLRHVETYLSGLLKSQLERDLRALRMVKESDLEACAYYHLRRFLRRDSAWHVFVRKHSRHTGHYIDLLFFRGVRPQIAIELKWNRKNKTMPLKDQRSLQRAIRGLRVKKAYFMTTLIGAGNYQKSSKTPTEKRRLLEIVIRLPLKGKPLEDWKKKRKAYTSGMARGRRRRKRAA